MAGKRKAPAGCYWRGEVLWARFEVRGIELRFSLYTNDGKIAARRLEERRALEHGAAHFGEIRKTYKEAFIAWGSWIAGQVGDQTVERYAVSLKQLEPELGELYQDEITAGKISEIVKRRQAGAVTIATIRRDLTALSSLLGYCEAMEWRDDNPALSWSRRLRERREPIVLPDAADLERVIARTPGKIPDMIRAYRATGCRLDELASARRAQLDRQRRELTIIGKGNKRRTIDLDPFGGFEILDRQVAFLSEPFIFWHDDGEPYRNFSSRFSGYVRAEFDAAKKRAGKNGMPDFRPFRLHDLRHLHAVEWLQSGRSIYTLQKRLGHASIKTTEIYLDFLTAEQQNVVKYGAA